MSKYGSRRGSFFLKTTKGRSPTIDVGCVDKIKQGKIKVLIINWICYILLGLLPLSCGDIDVWWSICNRSFHPFPSIAKHRREENRIYEWREQSIWRHYLCHWLQKHCGERLKVCRIFMLNFYCINLFSTYVDAEDFFFFFSFLWWRSIKISHNNTLWSI